MRTYSLAVALLLVPSVAGAQVEVWVDPVAGNDSNGGTGPTDAWRSTAHAVAQIQVPGVQAPRTVHLMPGTYAPASGESFPLAVSAGTHLVSTHGPAVTVFDPMFDPIRVFEITTASSAVARLEGVTVRRGDQGVCVVAAQLGDVGTARLIDLRVEDQMSLGIDFASDTRAVIERVDVRRSGWTGIRGLAQDVGRIGYLEMRDSTVRDCAVHGLVLVWLYDGSFRAEIERSRITGSGVAGAFFVEDGHQVSGFDNEFELRDCLIAGNQAIGVSCERGTCVIAGSTVADNGANGVLGATRVEGSIVHGHQTDVSGSPIITDSLIGVDPLFLDRAAGDYRLAWGSPAVDAGSSDASSTDLRGLPRRTDGDLDLAGAADMGALELQPLAGPMNVAVGQSWTLRAHGPAGGTAVLVLSEGGLAPFGVDTPFGRLFLPRRGARQVARVPTSGFAPVPLPLDLENLAALPGTTLAFQTLTHSAAAPAGAAWSNPLTVVVH